MWCFAMFIYAFSIVILLLIGIRFVSKFIRVLQLDVFLEIVWAVIIANQASVRWDTCAFFNNDLSLLVKLYSIPHVNVRFLQGQFHGL
jgi:hypothetical protein